MEAPDEQDLHRHLLGRMHGIGDCVRVHRLLAEVPGNTIQSFQKYGEHVHRGDSHSWSMYRDILGWLHTQEAAVDAKGSSSVGLVFQRLVSRLLRHAILLRMR